MKSQPSDDAMKVLWGLIALSKTHVDALDDARKVLTNILADDLQEEGEPISDLRKALSEWVDEIVWGSGEGAVQKLVDEAVVKMGYAADRFNKNKEAADANP
jgi:hypothetical protein